MEASKLPNSFWGILRQNFNKRRSNRWALRFLFVLVFIAVFGDFIANEKPYYCKIDGKAEFPILKSYGIDWGIVPADPAYFTRDWLTQEYDYIIPALIPYSGTSIDRRNMSATSPLGEQSIKSWRWRHWLGTDELGRDIAAGLIMGTRTALLVGLVAMSIALVIGLFLGLLAGYYGDKQLKIYWAQLILLLLALPFGFFYAFTVRAYQITNGAVVWEIVKGLLILSLILFLAAFLGKLIAKIPWLSKRFSFPLDSFIMRIIEVVNSLPGLLLILATLAIVDTPSILYVMVIIGLISWTTIARFVRAEILRIRELEYIQAAKALGFSDWRIMFKHALPNGLRPILITFSFGMAGAILLEAYLSFLGIGLPVETVTWGALMRKIQANAATGAWWIAVFPGLAIFITISLFNRIGEGVTEALDPKQIKQ